MYLDWFLRYTHSNFFSFKVIFRDLDLDLHCPSSNLSKGIHLGVIPENFMQIHPAVQKLQLALRKKEEEVL